MDSELPSWEAFRDAKLSYPRSGGNSCLAIAWHVQQQPCILLFGLQTFFTSCTLALHMRQQLPVCCSLVAYYFICLWALDVVCELAFLDVMAGYSGFTKDKRVLAFITSEYGRCSVTAKYPARACVVHTSVSNHVSRRTNGLAVSDCLLQDLRNLRLMKAM